MVPTLRRKLRRHMEGGKDSFPRSNLTSEQFHAPPKRPTSRGKVPTLRWRHPTSRRMVPTLRRKLRRHAEGGKESFPRSNVTSDRSNAPSEKSVVTLEGADRDPG